MNCKYIMLRQGFFNSVFRSKPVNNGQANNGSYNYGSNYNQNYNNQPMNNAPMNNAPINNAPINNAHMYNAHMYNAPIHSNANMNNAPIHSNAHVSNAPVISNEPINIAPVSSNAPLQNTQFNSNGPMYNAPMNNAPLYNAHTSNAQTSSNSRYNAPHQQPSAMENHKTIPQDINWRLYMTLFMNPRLNTLSQAQFHYTVNCIPNNSIYKMYYRAFYKIPAILNEESYITYLEKVHKLSNVTFNQYKNLYIYFAEHGSVLDEAYFRIHYKIPDELALETYNKRFNLKYSKERIHELYIFYSTNGYKLDDTYYRLFYNIPADFALETYNKRFNYSFTREECSKAAYKCFQEKGHTLDEAYYHLLYNIPADFVTATYIKRYDLTYTNEQHKELYTFYLQHSQEKPLDDAYYRLFYNIPTDFALEAYNKRYDYTFTTEQMKEAYQCFQEKGKPLDEEYLKLHFKITDTKFDWTAYLNAYSDDYFKEEETRINVYRHFGQKEYKKLSSLNEPYYRKLYNLPKEFSIENYISATPFLFKDDYYYALDVYSNKIILNDIYEETLKKTDKSLKEIKFLENYEYLKQFPEISSEKDKKYFIHLKEFSEAYYTNNINNMPACKENEEIKVVSKMEKITSVKRIKNPNYQAKNEKISQMESLSKIMAMASKLGVSAHQLGIVAPSQEIVISSSNAPVPPPQPVEKEYIEVTEVTDVEVTKEIKTIRLERYYDSLYFKLSDQGNVVRDIKTMAKNLYNTFTFKHQTDNLRNFSPYFSEKPTENNAIFYTFNNYPHASIVFRNNILKLGPGWTHTVICCLSNEQQVKEMCQEISPNIHLIVLPYQHITYNEWNNTLLQKVFWSEQILGETLIMYNENILFLEGSSINSLITNECLGYELPRIFTYNNCLNGYSDITFRKKSLVLETLNNLNNIQINNCLCKEIQTHFHLDKMPEDILYSYSIFNLLSFRSESMRSESMRSESMCSEAMRSEHLENVKKSIDLLMKNITIVNYKFSNLENCSLKQYIMEFIKIKY